MSEEGIASPVWTYRFSYNTFTVVHWRFRSSIVCSDEDGTRELVRGTPFGQPCCEFIGIPLQEHHSVTPKDGLWFYLNGRCPGSVEPSSERSVFGFEGGLGLMLECSLGVRFW